MNYLVLFVAVVILGFFGVLVINNTVTQPKTTQTTPLSVPTISTQSEKAPIPSPQENIQFITPTPLNSPTPIVATVESEPKATIAATIKTTKGTIELTLFNTDAPNTVKNFIEKATNGFYNNLTFHRVEDWVIQGGDPKGNGGGGGQMRTELNAKPFMVGSLGVARGDNINISNDAQFFITKKEASWLNQQYTNFGMVTKGTEVVDKIQVGDKILGITVE